MVRIKIKEANIHQKGTLTKGLREKKQEMIFWCSGSVGHDGAGLVARPDEGQLGRMRVAMVKVKRNKSRNLVFNSR